MVMHIVNHRSTFSQLKSKLRDSVGVRGMREGMEKTHNVKAHQIFRK